MDSDFVGNCRPSVGVNLTTIGLDVAFNPEMLKTTAIKVAVDTGSQLTRGMTLWDRRDHFRWDHLSSIRTATSIDSAMYQRTFVEALGGGQPR